MIPVSEINEIVQVRCFRRHAYPRKWIFAKATAQYLNLLDCTSHAFPFYGLGAGTLQFPLLKSPLAAGLHAPEAQLPLQTDLKGILLAALTLLYKTRQTTGSGNNQGNSISALLI